ncbi:type II toxin-antitoxin system RelE/ParE family toxin [Yersinia enterocolitica]|uniref:type II toxin-antitoxin system RelE/ParE family toxin n=1 Tax=Yersinia enterocolitica TaxID=630 RepID=UPI001C8E0A4E|nr:type II toxin-antitoxin system RelE/ParE family toxin [Yersinia enterocolitica]MBX9490094.1 type II toxin-antitoxin system RelE/ParE family toxin [Yersinia enterocolitica]MBX9494484.1 type II toxin-antitoxin system RelE/ParE family toxin [Yersinia enterocolitica]
MFTIIYHYEAEKEVKSLPPNIAAKLSRIISKLEIDPRQLREPDTKSLGNGLYEIRTMGRDIARGLWVYQKGERIFLLRVFIKKTPKTPKSEIDLAIQRLEEMLNDKV